MNLREWALPVYTILVQMSVGMFLSLWLLRTYANKKIRDEDFINELVKIPVLIVYFTILVAIAGSHFHLSRPFISFMAVSNFLSSWLSREITFTLGYFLLATVLVYKLWFGKGGYRTITVLGWGVVILGLSTVWCMTFIYLLPTQVAWNSVATLFSYYGTTLVLGMISLFVIFLMDIRFSNELNKELADRKAQVLEKALPGFVVAVIIAAIWVASANLYQIISLRELDHEPAQTSLSLILGLYKPLLYLRFIALASGLGCFIFLSFITLRKLQLLTDMIVPAYMACLFVLIGEILERFLFYATHVRIGI